MPMYMFGEPSKGCFINMDVAGVAGEETEPYTMPYTLNLEKIVRPFVHVHKRTTCVTLQTDHTCKWYVGAARETVCLQVVHLQETDHLHTCESGPPIHMMDLLQLCVKF